MKKSTIIFFSILSLCSKAQYNLVPNPSFEIHTTCPNSASQLTFATPWVAPTNNDADYFNSCATNINYGVPSQGVYNFQNAHTGNAYAGIFLYNGINNNYREYCSVQLINVLMAGKCYFINFYVNKSSRFYGKYAVNNIACALTTSYISNTGTGFILNLTPSVMKFGNPIISDTLNWVSVTGIYTAIGGEKQLTIGNFYNDTNTDTLNIGIGNYPGSGYLIDDVSVIPIDSIIGGMPANAGADQSIVIGDSVFIGQEISNLNCNWYELPGNNLIASNTSGVYVTPNTTTSYVVEQSLCGNVTYDTVKVMVSPTGIKEDEGFKNSVSLFPNPSDGEVFITITDNTINNVLVSVTDITGKFLYNEKMTITNNSLYVNFNVKAGIYFVTIVNTNTNEKIVKKLMIR
jgi:hypothetical protein